MEETFVHRQFAVVRDRGVQPAFDAAGEARRRIDFLKDYLVKSGLVAYVLGISGRVDTLAAGLLAQRAVALP